MSRTDRSMNRFRILPILAASLLIACGGAEAPQADMAAAPTRSEQEVTITTGTPRTLADISIDGMSCEMMCGGSIKKALAQLPGVAGTEIEFHEGDVTDHAIVTFDPAQVTDAQMVEAIQALHDGQYKVMAVSVTREVKGEGWAPAAEEAPEGEGNEVSASLPSLLVPSIFELLSQIVRF